MTDYAKLCSEFYALDKPLAPPDAFDFYESAARRSPGPIHEPMCGTGRFLLPLLGQGLDIEGSDSSPNMLASCRARGHEQGLSPALHEQTLQSFEVSRQLGLVFIPSGSFGLLIDQAAVQASLQRVFAALLPGGTFLVEVERLLVRPPEVSGNWGGRWVERPDGAKIILSWLSQYSGAPNISQSLHRYELVRNGQLVEVEFQDFRVRCYHQDEFGALLVAAGFSDIQALRPYEGCPADDSDEAFVFSARKA